jgi:hypothetical protein
MISRRLLLNSSDGTLRVEARNRCIMDNDLEQMSRQQLIDEIKNLRDGIRTHRDSTKDELCWHHPALWGLLPEKTDPVPLVPTWPEFVKGCIKYRQSLDEQAPHAPRTADPYEE